MLHFLAVRKQMAQALGNMPSLAGKLLRAPVTGRTPCSANVACATPPEGPSLDDQSVINGKIMLGALSGSICVMLPLRTPQGSEHLTTIDEDELAHLQIRPFGRLERLLGFRNKM
ncbi:uncharacterized protein CLUP02_17001 [Colletotrichum lupini]|uniref:Uncharacterized protein n=1 Tax=Colletotrichum lupini TaxID=145971 RepID=A0A9Q8TB85_9PEZI|nr:uncharacterized protein CLUP02_17001 [Colletotrichum lupini]UQC91466.1 hypothetical protein CLUP02_17001 [Colletotrichum lupini]